MSQVHIEKKRSPDKPSKHQVDCYVRWLRIKISKEYREASQEIRSLQNRVHEANKRFIAAQDARLPYLDSSVPISTEQQSSRQEYRAAQESVLKAQEALSFKEDETCKNFGLDQWWAPDDITITIKDAQYIVNPSYSVEVLDPEPDKRTDWYPEDHKEAIRALEGGDTWVEPLRSYTKADREGWLTLRVNLNAPLEESERAISFFLRANRENPPKTRNRHDKDAEALETWASYEQTKLFSAVAQQLQRPVNTVKGQYVRACVLIHGEPPTGSMKKRRAGIMRDAAGEFSDHQSSCSRCNKAKTTDEMCPKFLAFVNQETKALDNSHAKTI